MPAVLQKFMRHESIETTMRYYVDLDTGELAEDLWRQHEAETGTVLGTVGQNERLVGDGERDGERCEETT